MVIEIEIYNATDDSWLRSEPLIMIANQSKPFTVVQMVISCIAMEREKNNPILPLKSSACHRRNLCLPLREKWEGEIGHSNRKLLPLLCSVKISLSFSRFLIPLPLNVIFMWAVCEGARSLSLSLKQRKVNAFFIIIFFYFISMHLCPSCTSTKQTRKSGLISLDISNIQDLKREGFMGWLDDLSYAPKSVSPGGFWSISPFLSISFSGFLELLLFVFIWLFALFMAMVSIYELSFRCAFCRSWGEQEFGFIH